MNDEDVAIRAPFLINRSLGDEDSGAGPLAASMYEDVDLAEVNDLVAHQSNSYLPTFDIGGLEAFKMDDRLLAAQDNWILLPSPVVEAADGVVFEAEAAVLAAFVVLLHFVCVLPPVEGEMKLGSIVFINRLDSFSHDTNHVQMTPVHFSLLIRGQ